MKEVTINSRKYDGSIHKSWKAELIEQKDDLLLFLGKFDQTVKHPDLGTIKRGTISYEYYWLNRWYNIFRFHEPNGDFRNYYCNINMPPTFKENTLDYVDLDIDILINKDMEYKVLDEKEFIENARIYKYPVYIVRKATSSLHNIKRLIKLKQFPFNNGECWRRFEK